MKPCHILFSCQLHGDAVQQGLRLRQLAAAHILAGQHTYGGLDDAKTVFFQLGQIVLGDGIFQHGRVHSRSYQLFAPGGQNRCGQHVVSQAVCQLGDDVGRGRGNQDQVCRLGQGDVLHIVLKIPCEGVYHAAVVGQGFKGQRGDELGGVLCHDHVYRCPCLAQTRSHICHLIGGDSAGNAQKHAFPL